MDNIRTILTSLFEGKEINVLQADGSEPAITRQQLGEMLEYSDPQKAIDNIHLRNQERLDPLSAVVKLRATDGKCYKTRVYGFRGVLEVCRYSKQPIADAVMDWAWEIMDQVRQHGMYATDNFLEMALADPLWAAGVLTQYTEERTKNCAEKPTDKEWADEFHGTQSTDMKVVEAGSVAIQ